MFREDSQIDFVEENILLKVSLRPLLPPAYMLHSKIQYRNVPIWRRTQSSAIISVQRTASYEERKTP